MRQCFLCGRNGHDDPLDKHHIFNGALRTKSEKCGLTVYLCHDRCHENGREAAHRNRATRDLLMEYGELLWLSQDETRTIADFIREFGKNVLDACEGTFETLRRSERAGVYFPDFDAPSTFEIDDD